MKINENLVFDSAKEIANKEYLVVRYQLSEAIELGKPYVVSLEIEATPDYNLMIFSAMGQIPIGRAIKFDEIGNRSYLKFQLPELEFYKTLERLDISFYNMVKDEDASKRSTKIKNVKLEKGTEATLYVPNKADFKDSSLYPNKVGGGVSNGRKYVLFRGCCLC